MTMIMGMLELVIEGVVMSMLFLVQDGRGGDAVLRLVGKDRVIVVLQSRRHVPCHFKYARTMSMSSSAPCLRWVSPAAARTCSRIWSSITSPIRPLMAPREDAMSCKT